MENNIELFNGSGIRVEKPQVLISGFCNDKALETLKYERSYSL